MIEVYRFLAEAHFPSGITYDTWEVEPARLETDEFLQEVADRFAELIEIGHDLLTTKKIND